MIVTMRERGIDRKKIKSMKLLNFQNNLSFLNNLRLTTKKQGGE